jgi:hypothetical protein
MKLPPWMQIFAEHRQEKWHAFLFVTGININLQKCLLAFMEREAL